MIIMEKYMMDRLSKDMSIMDIADRSEADCRVRQYIIPESIKWKTDNNEKSTVDNEKVLLEKRSGQITLKADNACILKNMGEKAGILLDFGVELQGGIQILSWSCGKNRTAKLRVRFGESVMEAMSEIGQNNSTNAHAVRDQILDVTTLGTAEIGNTGFRFVRIDLLDDDSYLEIKSVRAVFIYKNIEYKGSFCCNDPLLNKIWSTGAYTVHLNIQNYLWDGIKRDRLVWIGDMHPETSTIQAVFGYDDSVPKSLDFIRDETKLPEWMNGIPSYSMWWILIHHSWYMQNGSLDYLKEQKDYLIQLLNQLDGYVDADGRETTPGFRFIDWPSASNSQAVDAALHALCTIAMEAGAELCRLLKEEKESAKALKVVERLRKYKSSHHGSKQAAALLALAGLEDANAVNMDVLSLDGAKKMSTFIGYYILRARALAGDIPGCLDTIRKYWGGMLELGATTFWEDFNIEWMENASRVDEITPDGKIDIHGNYGDHCYKGYRHSLCHGWASGPTAWLSEFVLGVKVVEPGCSAIKISPELGDLQWVEGTYPTPKGIVYIKHERQQDGRIKSTVNAPEGIKVIK